MEIHTEPEATKELIITIMILSISGFFLSQLSQKRLALFFVLIRPSGVLPTATIDCFHSSPFCVTLQINKAVIDIMTRSVFHLVAKTNMTLFKIQKVFYEGQLY